MTQATAISMDWFKICREDPYLMIKHGKTMVSCRFSLQSIEHSIEQDFDIHNNGHMNLTSVFS